MMEFVVQCLYNAASVATGFGAVVSVPIVANQHPPWLPPRIAHKLAKNETSRTSHIIAAPEMTTVYTKSVSYITQTTLFGIDRTTTVHDVAPTVLASHPAVTTIKSPYDNTCKDYLTNLYPKVMMLSIIIGIALCLLHMYNHRRMRSHQEQQPGIDDLHLDIVSTQDAFDAPTQTEPTYQDERKPGAIPEIQPETKPDPVTSSAQMDIETRSVTQQIGVLHRDLQTLRGKQMLVQRVSQRHQSRFERSSSTIPKGLNLRLSAIMKELQNENHHLRNELKLRNGEKIRLPHSQIRKREAEKKRLLTDRRTLAEKFNRKIEQLRVELANVRNATDFQCRQHKIARKELRVECRACHRVIDEQRSTIERLLINCQQEIDEKLGVSERVLQGKKAELKLYKDACKQRETSGLELDALGTTAEDQALQSTLRARDDNSPTVGKRTQVLPSSEKQVDDNSQY